jgi:type IV pilus assembly protein PilC
MGKFTYKGATADGTAVTETVDADDRFAVYEIARSKGHTVNDVKEASTFSLRKIFNIERVNTLLSRVSIDELTIFTRNLSSMLTAGLPLSRCLSVLERQSKHPRLKAITKQVQQKINQGAQFYEALGDFPETFSSLYISMARAGEESGGLADALKTLSVQLERSSNLQKKIKGAMIYPAIVVSVMVIIGILMMIYVMPAITATFKKLNVDLPLMTEILISVSDFVSQNSLLTIGIMLGTVIGFIYVLRTRPGKIVVHFLVTRLPVIGNLVKETNAARTARTLSSLLSSGVEVISALKITEDVVQNIYYKKVVREATAKVEKGDALSATFAAHTDLYPILVGEMIMVGEETGQISQMLVEVANFYENEVEMKTKDLSTIVEPLLMVIIGATVGFFALAMIAPIYSISDSIG